MGLFYHFNTGGFFHLPFECLQCGTPIVNILIGQECDEMRIFICQIVRRIDCRAYRRNYRAASVNTSRHPVKKRGGKRSQWFGGDLQRPKN